MAELPEDLGKRARAEARKSWPVRVYRLGDEPSEDLSAVTTAAQRLEMMWPLALDAWSLSGRAMPDYPRERTPVRVVWRRSH
jgi:hypothetical protein